MGRTERGAREQRAGTRVVVALALGCWSILAIGLGASARVGHPAPLVLAAGTAASAVLARIRTRVGGIPGGPGPVCLGALLGFAALPAWSGLLVALAGWIGLDRSGLHPIAPDRGVLSWIVVAGAAPLVEEWIYREELPDLLAPRIGTLGAVAFSTALFAISHVVLPAILASLLLGLVLAAIRRLARSVAWCIGVHGGINAGILWHGLPPPAPDPVVTAMWVSLSAALVAWGVARRR